MTWRNQLDHKQETKAVKGALVASGINASVKHGTGTAWAWLEINLGPNPIQHKRMNGSDGHADFYDPCTLDCPACLWYRNTSSQALAIAKQVTGRTGQYDGEINILSQ